MLVLSGIIYVVASLAAGPLWPLALIGGKGGLFGYVVVILWLITLIAGLNS